MKLQDINNNMSLKDALELYNKYHIGLIIHDGKIKGLTK